MVLANLTHMNITEKSLIDNILHNFYPSLSYIPFETLSEGGRFTTSLYRHNLIIGASGGLELLIIAHFRSVYVEY